MMKMGEKGDVSRIEIRDVKVSDLPKIASLYKKNPSKYVGTASKSLLYLLVSHFFRMTTGKVAISKRKDNNLKSLIGYADVVHSIVDKKGDRYFGILISKEFRGLGVGKILMDALLKEENNVILDVHSDNHNAIKLYEKIGFKKEYEKVYMRLRKEESEKHG